MFVLCLYVRTFRRLFHFPTAFDFFIRRRCKVPGPQSRMCVSAVFLQTPSSIWWLSVYGFFRFGDQQTGHNIYSRRLFAVKSNSSSFSNRSWTFLCFWLENFDKSFWICFIQFNWFSYRTNRTKLVFSIVPSVCLVLSTNSVKISTKFFPKHHFDIENTWKLCNDRTQTNKARPVLVRAGSGRSHPKQSFKVWSIFGLIDYSIY